MNKLIIIGLGNPGEKYRGTRHNAGKMLAAYLRQHPVEGLEVLETDCYMNRSGGWVKRWLKKSGLLVIGYWSRIKAEVRGEETSPKSQRPNQQPTTNNQQPILFIAHDDLDIPLGKFKIQFGKGPRLHKGILSVEQALGTNEFWRIRIGIENRKNKMATMAKNGHNGFNYSSPSDHYNHLSASGSDYVLERFTAAEKKILEAVFPDIRDRLLKKVQPFMAKNVVI